MVPRMATRIRPRCGWPAVAVLAAGALVATSCAGPRAGTDATVSRRPTDPSSPTTPTRPWTDIKDAQGTALPIADADWLQVVNGRVWTSQEDANGATRLLQVDPTTGATTATVNTRGSTCTALDIGFGSLWAAECSEPSAAVLRVDPRTGRLQARVPLTDLLINEEGSVAAAEGSVWVVTKGSGKRLVKVDPKTNRVVGRYALPDGVTAVRAGLGALWATNAANGELLRIEPRTAKLVATIRVGAGARFFAVGAGAVWVQNNLDGTVSRVSAETNAVVATIPVDSTPVDGGDLAVGGGYVWARVSSWLVSQIDPATNAVIARYGPGAGSGSVAAGDGALWISAHDVDQVFRLPLPKS